ncbi:MAG: hypothetical protein IJD78_07190 [Clostridia bacterium]|nr:hypothetical protein [Clostridia bacterium]MBQ3044339.1 hypothetical protein [Clostridia bacterium]
MRIRNYYYSHKCRTSERYIKFVSNMNTEKLLRKEPTCVNDKAYGSKELCVTDTESITARNPMHDELEKKYSLSKIASGTTEFERTVNLLKWLTDNTFYCGMQHKQVTDNGLDILDFSFGKSFENAINCRAKAIVFADCLVAVGIKAYPIMLLSLKFRNCHLICRVYLKELDKWCAFDPSFGCYFTDENGSLLDVFEVRDMLIRGKEPAVCGYNFNGTTECFDAYMDGFLRVCISNISTWDDNSLNRRDKIDMGDKKKFCCAVPSFNN